MRMRHDAVNTKRRRCMPPALVHVSVRPHAETRVIGKTLLFLRSRARRLGYIGDCSRQSGLSSYTLLLMHSVQLTKVQAPGWVWIDLHWTTPIRVMLSSRI